MAKNSVADLLSVGSLFTTQAERDEAQRETVRDIPLDEISDFPNHPFKVRMDESMYNYDFDCNIQQVKRSEFDVLYYGLFFADHIAIFKMYSNEILSCFGYSDKQHKGNEGEGQFHLNRSSIDYHMQNHFVQWLTYEELYDLLKALEK